MLNRTPKGMFCDRSLLLYHWLPWLLDNSWSNPLPQMLERAAVWCRIEAGDELKRAGSILKDTADENWIPGIHIRNYDRQLATAKLLRETAEKVREIWK